MVSGIAVYYCNYPQWVDVISSGLSSARLSLTTSSLQVEVCKRKETDIPLGWGVNSKGQVRVPVHVKTFVFVHKLCTWNELLFTPLPWEGYSKKFNTWRLNPEVQPFTFYIPFLTEKILLSKSHYGSCSFLYLLLTNGPPFTFKQ